MESTLILYPFDPSTIFLLESFEYLKEQQTSSKFYKILPNKESHEIALKLINEFNNIIFMGHGSFNKLSSSKSDDFDGGALITIKEISEMDKKNWILFSCNSNDLLKRWDLNVAAGIGFGDLPTDFNDIRGIREFEANAYKEVNEIIIEDFKKAIVWIINKSISEYINGNKGIEDLYYYIRLLTTRYSLSKLRENKSHESYELMKLLFDMKNDSKVFINP